MYNYRRHNLYILISGAGVLSSSKKSQKKKQGISHALSHYIRWTRYIYNIYTCMHKSNHIQSTTLQIPRYIYTANTKVYIHCKYQGIYTLQIPRYIYTANTKVYIHCKYQGIYTLQIPRYIYTANIPRYIYLGIFAVL